MRLKGALSLITALLLCAVAAAPAGAIVGGQQISNIADFPYQAALVLSSQPSMYAGQFCGASIRDSMHVITAAHCVYDNAHTDPGEVIRPSALGVLVGTTPEGYWAQRLDPGRGRHRGGSGRRRGARGR